MGMISNVADYFIDGCGRCDLHATDACKARIWSAPLALLREALLASGLKEEVKWGQPTYTLNGKNVAMLYAMKEHCGISFFKGILLEDASNKLSQAGPNTHAPRLLKITSAKEIETMRTFIEGFIKNAIKVEREGTPIPEVVREYTLPSVLEERLLIDADFASAWEALTPGRQRSYILHIGGAKQEKTQHNRLQKSLPKIYAGKGFNEY